MRRALVALLALAACSSGDDDTQGGPITALDLTIEYDSSLDVRSFAYAGRFDDGRAALERGEFEAPLFLEPPGTRRVTHRIALDETGELALAVDGVDGEDRVLGSGAVTVKITSKQIVEARVRLGLPSECGDGRRSGLEQCDDGNTISGDGCNAACEREPDERPSVYETEVLDVRSTSDVNFGDVEGATLAFAPNEPDETWLVFVSGAMRSSESDEVAAEMRVLLNDEEVDLWGHQNVTSDDSWAGFLTFVPITGTDEMQTIHVQFRAEVGTTEVRQLRIAASRLPPGADPQIFEDSAIAEEQGGEVNLGAVTFTPQAPGDYVVLAKMAMNDLPGGETVRGWLEMPGGTRVPEDDDGTTWANPKAAWVPMFAAARAPVGTSATFTLRGASSSSGSTTGWWDLDFAHRIRLSLTSGATVTPAGYAVSVEFDHASLVAAGESRADGDDVRIVHDGVELNRVVDPTRGWDRSDTTVWFLSADRLDPGQSDGYELYHGQRNAPAPPGDPDDMFILYDDFAGTSIDAAKWVVSEGRVSVTGGEMTVDVNSLVGAGNLTVGPNVIVEARARLSNPTGSRMRWLALWGGNNFNSVISFFADDGDQHAQTDGEITHFTLPEMTSFHRWAIARESSRANIFWQDEDTVARHAPTNRAGLMSIGMENTSPEHQMIYDWIRVRSFVLPEPTVNIVGQDSVHGGLPSRWRYRRIVAFRADAWDRVDFAEARGSLETTSPDFTPAVSLVAPAPLASTDYLVIQSERVSGDLDSAAHKVGEIRAAGDVLLETAHRSERGSATFAGYHHLAGVADIRTTGDSVTYENGCRSPDGITVLCADSVILVLRH